MSPKAPSIVGVALGEERVAWLRNAAQKAFPGSYVTAVGSLEMALQGPETADEILVLSQPSASEMQEAARVTDATGLPRWTVLAFATEAPPTAPAMFIPENADAPVVEYALQSSLSRHRLSRELARARGDLRTIAYRVSHDLRAPLGGIVTTGEALKEALEDSAHSGAAMMDTIFESADRMAKMIERVSFVARASANSITKARIDMGDIWWSVQQRLERQMLQTKATLVTPPSWPVVHGVASWLEVVWWNLLANALQHGGKGLRIEVGCAEDESGHRFWVHDNGSGVASERRRQLFQPFHTLHNMNSKRGFGLSIVHRLMELQDGVCGYEPLPAGGSKFWFALPVEKTSQAVHADTPMRSP
jgi:signal transduction histidine kinase